MAIPTLTACTPSALFTGGQLVTLTGTNFRGPYPIASSGPVPAPLPTMEILFDGVPAARVGWLSATSATCVAPNHNPGTASITLRNLDVDGDPISGETVTVAGMITYARADLTIESDFTRLTRALLLLLAQQTIANVVQTTETDYADGTLTFVNTAELPCVVLMAPTTKGDQFYDWELTPERSTGSDTFEQRRFMKTVDVSWKILVLDDHQTRMQNLLALVQQFFTINNWLYLDRDPSNSPLGNVRYEMESGDFGSVGVPNSNNVRGFSGDVTVRGFTYEDIAGFPGTMLSRTGGTADTIQLSLFGDEFEI